MPISLAFVDLTIGAVWPVNKGLKINEAEASAHLYVCVYLFSQKFGEVKMRVGGRKYFLRTERSSNNARREIYANLRVS